ncbi:hypothetical protein MKQ68_22475 [Chitinophaga horti]|uniref:Uncharacterized protein n=1 Tax=Chitinophaga horti TaxID=2920382 RepID=A0ABY6IZQ1_9BACT|nr:hypothetical protein [Chitinophaga horti]UYQ92850.1 hypothetical protein MKQ68_22475 [Chitinophaga horti]
MANNQTLLSEENIYSWICSTGYLLPSNEQELSRFERLHPPGSRKVNSEAIDPFAILNGIRKRKVLSIHQAAIVDLLPDNELRMAARKHGDLPADIHEQIKKNQEKKKDDQRNGASDSEGNSDN